MAIVISDTFDFNSTSYHYEYTGDTGSDVGAHFLASNYAPQVTYWNFNPSAVYGKYISSAVINLVKDIYTISSGKTITVKAACALLSSTTDRESNVILSSESSKFDAMTSEVTLPSSGSVNLDITNVIKYAAENYNAPWGLYLIGGGDTGYASSVTINTPTFTNYEVNNNIINIHNGSSWIQRTPYIHNGSNWVKSKAVFIHNGSMWLSV